MKIPKFQIKTCGKYYPLAPCAGLEGSPNAGRGGQRGSRRGGLEGPFASDAITLRPHLGSSLGVGPKSPGRGRQQRRQQRNADHCFFPRDPGETHVPELAAADVQAPIVCVSVLSTVAPAIWKMSARQQPKSLTSIESPFNLRGKICIKHNKKAERDN
jgi:hypothetical protein